MPADGPGHQVRPRRTFWFWQKWQEGRAHACAMQNETSCGKRAQNTQTNTELPIHRPHMPADGPGHQVRPRRTFWSWQMWQGGRAHACAAGLGRAKTTSCGKRAQNTQTNTDFPIRRPHMPLDGQGYQARPRRTFWSWQMWQGGRAHACAAGLGRAKTTSCGKRAQNTQTNTDFPIRCPHMPLDGPGHQARPRRTFWSWQMWQGGRANACAAGLGGAK